MTLSVVVPALDEERVLAAALGAARQPGVGELLVVDGGSVDATVAIARRHADRVIVGRRGRARQMNAGAAVACGDVLLFLHADSCPPSGYPTLIAAALADPAVVGGRFDVRLDASGLVFRMLERAINLRSRITRIATGDQGIFVRRDVFQRLGGYPDWPLMEDVALARALRRAGRVACVRAPLVTSARRWQRHGVVRTVLLMWGLRLAFYAGVSPAWLARTYAHVR